MPQEFELNDPFSEEFQVTTDLPPDPPYIISESGFAVDKDTGEYVGRVNTAGEVIPEPKEAFRLVTDDHIKWALRTIGRHESQAHNYQLEIERTKKLIADEQKLIAGFMSRFEQDLIEYAADHFKHGTKKCVTPWGDLYFRFTPGAYAVLNKSEAIAWALENYPAAAKPRTGYDFVVAPLKEFDGELPESIKKEPPGDKFYVTTTVSAELSRIAKEKKNG